MVNNFFSLLLLVNLLLVVVGCNREGAKKKTVNVSSPQNASNLAMNAGNSAGLPESKKVDTLGLLSPQFQSLSQSTAVPVLSNIMVQANEGASQALSLMGTAKEKLQTFSGRRFAVLEAGDRRLSFGRYQEGSKFPFKEVRFSSLENTTLFTVRFDSTGNLTQYFSFDSGFELYTNGVMKSAYGTVGGKTYEARWSEDGRLIEEISMTYTASD